MKDNYLRGKNVLLISYSFYDYHKAISDSIRSKGATVFYVDTYVSSKFGPLNQILLGLSKKRKLDFVIKNRITFFSWKFLNKMMKIIVNSHFFFFSENQVVYDMEKHDTTYEQSANQC